MTTTTFKKTTHAILLQVAEANGLNMNPAKVGGDLEYVQELTGRAMMALTQLIVEESLKPRAKVIADATAELARSQAIVDQPYND